jgi:hypothetical protein
MGNRDYEKIDYYNVGIECIEVIEALKLNFNAGNAFKYLYRSNNVRPKGDILHDLNKTIYYINRLLNKPAATPSTRATEYILKIHKDLFSENIFKAIECLLKGATEKRLEYYSPYLSDAIKHIELEINEIT